MFDPKLVRVTGQPRSGSTLLCQLLAEHLDIDVEGMSSPPRSVQAVPDQTPGAVAAPVFRRLRAFDPRAGGGESQAVRQVEPQTPRHRPAKPDGVATRSRQRRSLQIPPLNPSKDSATPAAADFIAH